MPWPPSYGLHETPVTTNTDGQACNDNYFGDEKPRQFQICMAGLFCQ